MKHAEPLSFKAFWDALEARLAQYSHEDLRNVLRAFANDVPASERRAFLDRLPTKQGAEQPTRQRRQQPKLVAEIDDLQREMRAMMKYADAWEESYDYHDYFHEEDSLGPYERFIEPLTRLFARARVTFASGDMQLTLTAYQKLFSLLELEDDYGRGVHVEDLDAAEVREARARYLRALYETEAPARQPRTLFEAMQEFRPRLMLEDLIQIAPQPLPNQERFLAEWIAFLQSKTGSDADAWLREAIRLSRGTPGLAELAQRDGMQRPRAYLDWCAALEQEGRYPEMLAAALEALRRLSERLPVRADIADHLYRAAVKLQDLKTQRRARWEALRARPTLARLLDWWDVTPSAERQRAMHEAVEYLEQTLAREKRSHTVPSGWQEDEIEATVWVEKSVLAHACLLSGQWGTAQQLAAREHVLGWSQSDNPQGLVVPYFLVTLSGKPLRTLPANLKIIWQSGLQASLDEGNDESRMLARLNAVYAEVRIAWSDEQQQATLSWCIDIVQKRVHAIVGEQHRGSYDKAATVLAACAETLKARGRAADAQELVEDIRKRFPRHSAFLSELDRVSPTSESRRRE